jgi:hypothetical protein
MGVEFFLISYDLPGRATFLPIYSLVDRSPHGMFRRLQYPTIRREDTISHIVERMCLEVFSRRHDRYSVDVIRIFAHGDNRPQGDHMLNGEPVHILLGEGLTPTTAAAFQGICHLWHTTGIDGTPRSYPLPAREAMRAIRRITPRIEMHACFATIHARPTLQALASAARVPVFAADILQATDDRPQFEMTNWDIEGTITSFYP